MTGTKDLLTKRDRRMLQFVDRYRLATNELFAEVFFTGPHQRTNADRVVRKLVQRKLLRKVECGHGMSYVVLTRQGCRTIDAPDRTPRPLTEQSLPMALAIAAYCVRTKIARLTDREFRQRYPELWRPGLRSSSYYLVDTPDGLKLGMFLIDRGGVPRRIRGRIRRVIAQRSSLPAFVSLMEAGRFRLTVLTGLQTHQDNIRQRLTGFPCRQAEVEVALVPELGKLLTMQ